VESEPIKKWVVWGFIYNIEDEQLVRDATLLKEGEAAKEWTYKFFIAGMTDKSSVWGARAHRVFVTWNFAKAAGMDDESALHIVRRSLLVCQPDRSKTHVALIGI